MTLLNYYIVHRSTGISYDPDYICSRGKIMTAISNHIIQLSK